MIKIFVGYDRRMAVLYNLFSYSIISRSSQPVSLTPLVLPQLEGQLKRHIDPKQSTEFSFSRFLVPYLCDFEGWSIFFDNDMLMLDDVAKLWELRDENYAIQVVKHDHVPAEERKFLGALQTKYEKKNWSSVVIFNNTKCRKLTPEYVSAASGLELHQFKWLNSDEEIGDIPNRWNHLVGYDESLPVEQISNIHYTSGGPYFEQFRNCEYAELWLEEKKAMLNVEEKSL